MNIYIYIFEKIFQLDLTWTLKREGFEVHPVETEKELIQKLEYKNIIVIITFKVLLKDDLMSILKSHPHVPIILLSADLTEEGFKELNLTPNFHFLKKPIHNEELKNEIKKIIDSRDHL